MPSVRIRTRTTKSGDKRYRVVYRLGGRESTERYGGSFPTRRLALARRAWIIGELAALRVPDVRLLEPEAASALPTLRAAADRWKATRVDVADSTRVLHRVALDRVLPILGDRHVDTITVADIVDLIAQLHAAGKKRETIRKGVKYLGSVLDYANLETEPGSRPQRQAAARGKRRARAADPPSTSRPSTGRFPPFTGSRCSGSGRALASAASTRRGSATTTKRAVASGCGSPRRSRVTRSGSSCPAISPTPSSDAAAARGSRPRRAAVRRIWPTRCAPRSRRRAARRDPALVAARPAPPARVAAAPARPLLGRDRRFVGQRKLSITADTYTHVLLDDRELDYRALLAARA